MPGCGVTPYGLEGAPTIEPGNRAPRENVGGLGAAPISWMWHGYRQNPLLLMHHQKLPNPYQTRAGGVRRSDRGADTDRSCPSLAELLTA